MGGYSLLQIELFLKAIERDETAKARVALIAARAANAKPDVYRRIMKEFGG